MAKIISATVEVGESEKYESDFYVKLRVRAHDRTETGKTCYIGRTDVNEKKFLDAAAIILETHGEMLVRRILEEAETQKISPVNILPKE